MQTLDKHTRWILEAPQAVEDELTDWLLARGATAMYRQADPPFAFLAYFPPGQELPGPEALAAFAGVRLLASEAFDDEDWLEKSREGFGPILVGRSFYIQPIWDKTPVPEDRTPIVVNPGLAFGTGGHETTRLCMALLEELAGAGRLRSTPILDIGAGTGILSLAAWMLGARGISAFDIDPDCGPAMDDFIELNALTLRGRRPFEHFVGTLDDARIKGPYQGLLANILLETIQELLPRMAQIAATGAWLVASGILAEREDEALLSLVMHGFRPTKVVREGEWIAILAERI
ncbi:MAG TPA: 50S ribosomal protein L11 methyltransferase [Holophaga sp.]|nr:50S ribosomal protein L11 methyltransferase [Holophaga sp.]